MVRLNLILKFASRIILYLILISSLACHKVQTDWVDNAAGRSILDLEYINDTLDILLQDIRIRELAPERFKLDVYVFPGHSSDLGKKDHFYLHFYPKKAREMDGGFLSVVTGEIRSEKNALVYSGELNSKRAYFELMRYGMVNKEGKRLFTLTVDSVVIR